MSKPVNSNPTTATEMRKSKSETILTAVSLGPHPSLLRQQALTPVPEDATALL